MKKVEKEEEIEDSWNIKRIGMAFLVGFIIISALVYLTLNNFSFQKSDQKSHVLSAQDEKLEDIFENQIMDIKKQVANLDVEEIASSSPEIRNLIEDLKALGNLPRNEAKEACHKICSNF